MLRTTRPFLPSTARLTGSGGRIGIQRVSAPINPIRSQLPRANGACEWRGAAIFPQIRRAEYSTKPPLQPNKIDKAQEEKRREDKVETRSAEDVTTESSVRSVFEASSGSKSAKEGAQDITAGVKADIQTVKETLDLKSVPPEPYALGLAGTLPYLGTSISTLYLSWNLRADYPTSSSILNSFMVSHETAQQWLAMLEPIQLGYGAVIISFLGAIHWGLEYGEKTPSPERTRFRYGIGLLAPALAWPTLLMPAQFALIGQFAAFTGLYFADARATTRGWAPAWYGTYRFVLTFIVGGAIFISLVGRAKVTDGPAPRHVRESLEDAMTLRGPGEEPYSPKWERLEEEEREKVKKEKEEEEKRKKEEKKKAKKAKKQGKKQGKEEKKKLDEKTTDQDEKADDDESDGDDDAKEESESDDGEDEAGEESESDDGDDEEDEEPESDDGDDNDDKDESKDDEEDGNDGKKDEKAEKGKKGKNAGKTEKEGKEDKSKASKK